MKKFIALLLTCTALSANPWKLTEKEPFPMLKKVIFLDEFDEFHCERPIDFIMLESIKTLHEPKIIAWMEIPPLPKELINDKT